jgi:large repetitive protein
MNKHSTSFSFCKVYKSIFLLLIVFGFSSGAYATCTIAAAPTNVKVSVASSSSVTVSFTRPTVTGTGTVTYTATSTPGSFTGTTSSGTSGGTGTITVTGLTSGTPYTFIVNAVADGGGNYSSTTSSSITPRTITTLYFFGTTNTDWGTATNWSTNNGTPSIGSAVPTANDIAVINTNKTVVIGASGATTAVCQKLTLSSGANLTNYSGSSLTISTTDVSDVTLTLSGGTFDNEGTLTVTNVNQTTPNYNSIACNGTNTLTFNGPNNLAVYPAGTSNALFVGGTNSATTIAGTGFTVGSAGSGTGVGYTVFSLSATGATVTINSGTTLNMYVGATGINGNGFYLSSSSSVINNGTLNVTGTTTSASSAVISAYEQTASTNTYFKNTGTFTVTGFNQPFSFGGSNGYNKFENTGTTDITTNSGGTYGLFSAAVLPNQYINSGTLKINAPTNAIKLNATGDTFTNTGTLTITKGSISGSAVDNTGIINFNLSDATGAKTATASGTILNNNSGGTINGSCTFLGTLVTNSGSTLSPGDYNTGTSTSGIGKMIITPTSSAFTLSGNVNIQVNGKTTAGTDYDQISFASTCALTLSSANTLTVTAGYTPSANDRISLISTTTKSGAFATTTVPAGWHIDYATATDIATKFAANTWTNGASDGLWSSAANWSSLAVPISTSDVSIGAYTVSNSGSAAINSLSLSGTNLTNSGTLTIAPATSKNGISINSATFDNEGTLSINTSYRCFELSGTNALTFNGTTTFAGSTAFVTNSSSATTLYGTGFSLGSVGTPTSYGLLSTTSTGSTFTINSGTTVNVYSNSGNVIYMSSSASVTNNGTLNIYTSTTGTGVHTLQIWQTTAGVNATFTNGSTGTLLLSGYEQPTVFGGSNTGSTGYCKFDNAGTATITTSSATNAVGLFSGSNLPNVFTNSGTLNISANLKAISLNAKSYNGSFTNTGTLNITKGYIYSAGASASDYNSIDNNSPGKINFNYGFPAGTTTATSAAIINNNSGATINGSCTFAASTLVTNSGSTLSPGDYSAGVSGIGKMIITPASSAFTLAGNVNLQVNGKTTAGTDYDQIAFTSTCALALSGSPIINLTIGYTPSYNDRISVISSNTLSGSLGSSSLPTGWATDYASTDVGVKYPKTAPGAPATVTATAGNTRASIAFTAPASDGGATVTSYTITPYIAGVAQTAATGITYSPYIFTGLTNGTAYTFTVTAINSVGTGLGTSTGTVTPDATANIINISTPTNTGDITLTPVSDISVSGTTLTVNGSPTVNSVTVASNAKLNLSGTNTLSISGDLLLKADQTNSFSANIGSGTLAVTGAIKYLRTIDASKWYFMAFPSDVTIAQITSTNQPLGTLGTDWFIKYYDGAKRGTYGVGSNWISITAADVAATPSLKLNKYQGYIFGLANGKPTTELSIPLDKTVVSTEPVNRNIPVAANNAGAIPITNFGWNLIGQPYLSNYVGSNTTGTFNIYISDGVSTYTPYTQATVPTLNPMSAYFIQASTDLAGTGITFNTAGRQSVKSVVTTDYASDKVQLNLTSATGTDYALLTMDNNFTSDYEIGYDLEKWIGTGTDKPQLYTQLNGINYAFNALPMTDVTNLPIGFYTKTAGTTTISANAIQAPGLSKLLLTDNSTNPATITDLLTSDYSFNAAAGTDNNRFVLTAQKISTANIIQTDKGGPTIQTNNSRLTISNLDIKATVRLYDAIGRMIVNKLINNNRLEIQLSAKGMYTIQIESGVNGWTKKFTNQ